LAKKIKTISLSFWSKKYLGIIVVRIYHIRITDLHNFNFLQSDYSLLFIVQIGRVSFDHNANFHLGENKKIFYVMQKMRSNIDF